MHDYLNKPEKVIKKGQVYGKKRIQSTWGR